MTLAETFGKGKQRHYFVEFQGRSISSIFPMRAWSDSADWWSVLFLILPSPLSSSPSQKKKGTTRKQQLAEMMRSIIIFLKWVICVEMHVCTAILRSFIFLRVAKHLLHVFPILWGKSETSSIP